MKPALTAASTTAQTELTTLLHAVAERLNRPDNPPLPSFGIGHGQAGLVLFNCHYAAYTNDARYYEHALTHLEQVLGRLSPQTYVSDAGSRYHQDLAELGILLMHLVEHEHLEWDTEPLLRQLDQLLTDRLTHHLAKRNFEITYGALGLGRYFLRRFAHSPGAGQQVQRIVEALQAAREGDETQGYYWTCHLIQEPRVYTGLSHGSAMIINFLASVYQAGIAQAQCATLLYYATHFLLHTRLDASRYVSTFPLWKGREEITENQSLLYGDLGTAFAIGKAARCLHHSEYAAEATRVARLTTLRQRVNEGFEHDASVWYGAAGTYLLYDAMHRQTGEAELALAARRWLERIPSLAIHQNDYLNFSTHFYTTSRNPMAQLCFNFGLVGVGLTLVQALSQGRYPLDEFIWLS